MIRAYSFESTGNGNGQLSPFNAKVDARVRRDMFNGAGNLIIVGDRNGTVTDERVPGELGGTVNVRFSDSVTFVAGGRLFTITGQDVPISTFRGRVTPSIGTGELCVDVDVNEPNGDFVKIVDVPSFDESPNSWELEKFSVTYTFVIVQTGMSPSTLVIYPSPEFNGQIRAGGTFNMGSTGYTMDGSDSPWRGAMTTSTGLYLTQTGDTFTLAGSTGAVKFDSETVSFARQGLAPYYVDITTGSCVLMSTGWVAIGEISSNPKNDGTGYNFEITNVTTVSGVKPATLPNANIITTFTGSWDYF